MHKGQFPKYITKKNLKNLVLYFKYKKRQNKNYLYFVKLTKLFHAR